jgi:DNA replication protein DnaC
MLIHPMVERLRGLGLTAMADAFIEMQNASAADDLSREDWLGLLLDREATNRENKRLGRRLRHARLRQSAVIEDTDFRAQRGLDRALFQKLATCRWVRDNQHLVIGGPTGVGKSWLACALGHKRAGKVSRCSTGAPHGCSPSWQPRVAKDACRG